MCRSPYRVRGAAAGVVTDGFSYGCDGDLGAIDVKRLLVGAVVKRVAHVIPVPGKVFWAPSRDSSRGLAWWKGGGTVCNCQESKNALPGSSSLGTATALKMPVAVAGVPIATPLAVSRSSVESDVPAVAAGEELGFAVKSGGFTFCHLDFRDGCYQVAISTGVVTLGDRLEGTLRVDRVTPESGPDGIIVSGDLYRAPDPVVTPVLSLGGSSGDAPATSLSAAAQASSATLAGTFQPRPPIPIFPRSRYHSYLKITQVSIPFIVTKGRPCQVTLTAEQFDYTQPPPGQFQGFYPVSPTRTVTIVLRQVPAPPFFASAGGPYFEGRIHEGAVDRGAISLGWVAPSLRRATVTVRQVPNTVSPPFVPDGSGGVEHFNSIYARAGWELNLVRDHQAVPIPPGVTPTDCWSSANLHALMSAAPAADLDAVWNVNLLVVQAKLGCLRGKMFDLVIGTPREGCVTYCDDGYPTSESSNFGTAANRKQRDVPRAYLRSAAHEVTHTFNQHHEMPRENSIMTPTDGVADVLAGPSTGAAGGFPDQIDLNVSATVRHRLNHMPDPVVRPGGWPFKAWLDQGNPPQATDRASFLPSELELAVSAGATHVALGQPVELSWTLTNRSAVALVVPNDVSIEALFATIMVTNGAGQQRPARTFVISCDHATLAPLKPGQSISAKTWVFWSTAGFAFEDPGRYRITVSLQWSAQGVQVGIDGSVDLFVDYPSSDADNWGAELVLHPDVGIWVALGGDAYHLAEACRRLAALATAAGTDREPKLLVGFRGLLPDPHRLGETYSPPES